MRVAAKVVHDHFSSAEWGFAVHHPLLCIEILEERVVSSTNRVIFRGVKRKMSNYNLRPRKRQRTRSIDVSKRIGIVK